LSGMSIIVKTATRLITPLILVLAANVIMHGHFTPGGGFQGGALLGAAFILYVVAMGYEECVAKTPVKHVLRFQAFGLSLIALTSLTGICFGFFMQNQAKPEWGLPLSFFPEKWFGVEALSAGSIPLLALGESINVGMGFLAAFLFFTALREIAPSRDDEKR